MVAVGVRLDAHELSVGEDLARIRVLAAGRVEQHLADDPRLHDRARREVFLVVAEQALRHDRSIAGQEQLLVRASRRSTRSRPPGCECCRRGSGGSARPGDPGPSSRAPGARSARSRNSSRRRSCSRRRCRGTRRGPSRSRRTTAAGPRSRGPSCPARAGRACPPRTTPRDRAFRRRCGPRPCAARRPRRRW